MYAASVWRHDCRRQASRDVDDAGGWGGAGGWRRRAQRTERQWKHEEERWCATVRGGGKAAVYLEAGAAEHCVKVFALSHALQSAARAELLRRPRRPRRPRTTRRTRRTRTRTRRTRTRRTRRRKRTRRERRIRRTRRTRRTRRAQEQAEHAEHAEQEGQGEQGEQGDLGRMSAPSGTARSHGRCKKTERRTFKPGTRFSTETTWRRVGKLGLSPSCSVCWRTKWSNRCSWPTDQ